MLGGTHQPQLRVSGANQRHRRRGRAGEAPRRGRRHRRGRDADAGIDLSDAAGMKLPADAFLLDRFREAEGP